MAEQGGIRVADLFPGEIGLGPAMAEAEGGAGEAESGSVPWGLIAGPAEAALRSLLECDVIELLAQGWLHAKAFRAYADPAQYPPDETVVVHLAEHSFVREIHPVLDVTVAGCPPLRLRFTVALAAQFSGVALSIRDGHILGGTLGDASVSAGLSYGSVKLAEKESGKLSLPGRFAFAAPGLRIPPPPSTAGAAPAEAAD